MCHDVEGGGERVSNGNVVICDGDARMPECSSNGGSNVSAISVNIGDIVELVREATYRDPRLI